MNIFYLDYDPTESARCLVDKHVVKMPIESAQLLSTAHRVLDGTEELCNVTLYKKTHQNHPSAKWVRNSIEHYRWLYQHYISICVEYTRRYGKKHKSQTLQYALSITPKHLPNDGFVEPPQVMPNEYKSESTVEAYRDYYRNEKKDIASWSNTISPPNWFNRPKGYVAHTSFSNLMYRDSIKNERA